MNFLDAASLTAVTSSTFPGLSRAEGLREVQALNSDENQAASQHEQQQPTQDLLVHGDGKNGGGLLAGWLAAEAPTPHLSGRETCRAISDERARSNGYLDGMSSSSSSHHRHSGGYKTSRAITRGDVVSVERPVAAMQTSSALPWVIACPGCLRHVGTLDLQLAIASGRCDRARALEFDQPPTPRCTERFASRASGDSENDISRAKEHGTAAAAAAAARAPTTTTGSSRDHSSVGKKVGQEASRTFHEEDGREEDGREVGREEHRGVRRRGGHGGGGDCNGRLPTVSGLSDRFMEATVACSMGCGALYCSDTCRRNCWEAGHCILCLGRVEDNGHPLVKHKVHALTDQNAEVPLLMAAQLLIQAAFAVKRARESSPSPLPSSWSALHPSSSLSALPSSPPTRPSCSHSSPTPPASDSPPPLPPPPSRLPLHQAIAQQTTVKSENTGSTEDRDENAAVHALLTALFPRGRFHHRSGCRNRRAVNQTVVSESWALLMETLSATFHDVAAAASASAIDPTEMPVLLSRRVHADVVDGLAANLLDVEVQSPLVDYCEALVTMDSATQLRALEILEPAFASMEQDDDESEDNEDKEEEEEEEEEEGEEEHEQIPSSTNTASPSTSADPPLMSREASIAAADGNDNSLAATVGFGDNGTTSEVITVTANNSSSGSNLNADHNKDIPNGNLNHSNSHNGRCCQRPTLKANRAAARRAWRCLQAARAAARLAPPLSARALLLGSASLPHSDAPAARVPAGNPRSYNSGGGGRGGGAEDSKRAGIAGWPLTVACVALRDLPANAPITTSWVDDEDWSADDGEEDWSGSEQGEEEEEGRAGDAQWRAREPVLDDYIPFFGDQASFLPGRTPGVMGGEPPDDNGSGRSSHGEDSGDDVGGSGASGGRVVSPRKSTFEKHLVAAQHAVGEYRFDDAFDNLQRAAELDPTSGDVLYRAGVCAINQGAWSRALRLWRDGLALSPDHAQLRQEADKYDSLAFWLDPPPPRATPAHDAEADTTPSDGRYYFRFPAFGPPPPEPSHEPIRSTATEIANGGDTGSSLSNIGDSSIRSSDNLDITFMGGDEWVCETRIPPLSAAECAAVIAEAEAKAAAAATAKRKDGDADGVAEGTGWGTTRHYSVPTTDMAVRDLPKTLAWFNRAMRDRIGPLVAAAAALGKGELELSPRSSSAHGPQYLAANKVDEVDGDDDCGDVDTRKQCVRKDVEKAYFASADTAAATVATPGVSVPCVVQSTSDSIVNVSSTAVAAAATAKRASTTTFKQASLGDGLLPSSPSTAPATATITSTADTQLSLGIIQNAFMRRLRVHDAFVVRYDAAAQRSLPLHTDQGELSLTISLNTADHDYEGGGTWFEGLGRAVRPTEAGHVVVFPGGETVHGGREITRGVRYILAVFLYEHRVEEEKDEDEENGGDAGGKSMLRG